VHYQPLLLLVICAFGLRWRFINACQAQQVWFLRKRENNKLRELPNAIRIYHCSLILFHVCISPKSFYIRISVELRLSVSAEASMRIYKCMSSSTSLISTEIWEWKTPRTSVISFRILNTLQWVNAPYKNVVRHPTKRPDRYSHICACSLTDERGRRHS